jgi:hypothetical protein
VMGTVQDGKVIFAHEEDRQRLAALAKAP